jgi:hypothetical protein
VNQQLKNNLILVGVIFALVIIGYYVMSPYQHCLSLHGEETPRSLRFCSDNTDW